jgi:mRNA-degrading endonuclease RelE of RelBE toxin-antitoxin system
MNSSDSLKKAIKIIESLSEEEKKQLLNWILEEKDNHELSQFSYLTSHSVLEKEWLNAEEDKAWENL